MKRSSMPAKWRRKEIGTFKNNPPNGLPRKQQPEPQDECGWFQSGLPDSGGLAVGAMMRGAMGARASFFCCAVLAD